MAGGSAELYDCSRSSCAKTSTPFHTKVQARLGGGWARRRRDFSGFGFESLPGGARKEKNLFFACTTSRAGPNHYVLNTGPCYW